MGTRPAFGTGPRPPRPPMGAGGAPSFDPSVRRAPGSNFGPDAPPKGKKGKFNRPEPRGPKGPIRVKPNGRIYSTDEYGEEANEAIVEDDFATSIEPGDDTEEQ
jgi:hypothetical protein